MMASNRGFTTIELITVIIIMAILAVNILPRFDGTASYEAHTHRAQLISALRLTQQRAMQQTDTSSDYCHQLIIENDRYGIASRVDCSNVDISDPWKPDATGHIVDTRYDITFSVSFSGDAIISFDWMGRPLNGCSTGCTIDVGNAVEPLTIKIEQEGYIRGL